VYVDMGSIAPDVTRDRQPIRREEHPHTGCAALGESLGWLGTDFVNCHTRSALWPDVISGLAVEGS
jgi:hypothetical protein